MSPRARETSEASTRIPWVTYGLAFVCAAGFIYAKVAALEAEAVVGTTLATAEDYFKARPYLVLPPLLERRLQPETAERVRQSFHESRLRRSAPPIPPRIQLREQAELDGIVASADAALTALPAQTWGLRATERAPGSFLTHPFIHGGWLHLIGNLVLLLLLGVFLERAWGGAVLACALAACGAGAAGVYTLQNPQFSQAYVGISGLLAGLLGAFAVSFRRTPSGVSYGVGIALGGLILVLPVWLGFEWSIARSIEATPAESGAWNPSIWAVLGGFGSGLLVAGLVRLLALDGPVERAGVDRALRRAATDARVERAHQEQRAGRLDEAFNLLTGILRREPENLAACDALWEVANDLERPGAAAAAILRVIRHQIQEGDLDSALRHWLELVETGLDADAEPALLLRMASLLRDAGEGRAAARALRNALARSDASEGSALAARVAREASDLDPAVAEDAAWRALGSLDLDLNERQGLESLLEELQPQLSHRDESETPGWQPAATVSAADLVAPGEDDEPGAGVADTRPDPIELADESRHVEILAANPIELDEQGLCVEIDGAKRRVRFDRIQAVAVAAVDGLAPRTVIVVDLVLNWMSLTAETLKVVRLRGDRFDPRRLATGQREPLDALRHLVEELLRASGATPLPDLQSARGLPFAAFGSLAAYHRDVLMVEASKPRDD